MTHIVAYFLLFAAVAVVFLMVPLLLGKLVRPRLPTPEKDAIYECGEPTIGSSYIQFDLRFYVVALLFIIFDVEVAFFFPWALVFGGATQLADAQLSEAARTQVSAKLLTTPELAAEHVVSQAAALQLAWFGLFDILVFFGVLLVGFIYVWKRGDLDWVRAYAPPDREAALPKLPPVIERPPLLEPGREAEPVG